MFSCLFFFCFFVCLHVSLYVSNHFNHCIKLFAPCGTLIGNNKFLFLFLFLFLYIAYNLITYTLVSPSTLEEIKTASLMGSYRAKLEGSKLGSYIEKY